MKQKHCLKGEVWLVNFNPGRGSEQKGVRPALVIQNNIGNQYAVTTIVAAITATLKKYPVMAALDGHEAGLKEPAMVNLTQILTIDKNRLLKKIGALKKEKLDEVNEALRVSLDLKGLI